MTLEEAVKIYNYVAVFPDTWGDRVPESKYWEARSITSNLFSRKYQAYARYFPNPAFSDEENKDFDNHSEEEQNRRTRLRDKCTDGIREVLGRGQ